MLQKIGFAGIILCLNLVFFYQVSATEKTDSLKQGFYQSADALEKMKFAEKLAKMYKDMQIDSAAKYARATIKYAQVADNAKGLAMGYNWLGESYFKRSAFDSALYFFKKTTKVLKDAELDDMWAKSLLPQSNVYYYTNKFDSSIYLTNKVLKYQLENKDTVPAAITKVTLSLIYSRAGDYTRAIELLLDSRIAFLKIKDRYWEAVVNQRLGLVYGQKRELDSAISCYQRSISYWKQEDNYANLAENYTNIGVLFESKGDINAALEAQMNSLKYRKILKNPVGTAITEMNIGNLLMTQEKYDSAKIYLLKSVQCFEENNTVHPLIYGLMELGLLFHYQKKYDQAANNYQRAFQLALEQGYIDHQKIISEKMSLLYEEIQDFEQALKYERIFKARSDSILNEENIKRQTRAEENYKHEVVLLEKEKELLIGKQKRNYIIGLSIGLLLILLIIIFYRWKISKNRIERIKQENYVRMQHLKLETQKLERERVARILHDNLAHLIAFVKEAVQSLYDNPQNEAVRKKLADTRETLELMDKLARVASYELSFSYALDSELTEQCRKYIDRVSHNQKSRIVLEAEEQADFSQLTDEKKMNLFSVFQEMLGNAIKHANADHIHVYLYEDKGQIILRTEDDGLGFDYKEERHGQGIGHMNERAGKFGGSFSIESEKGFGTKAVFIIPK